MSVPLPQLIERCLSEHRERKIQALVDALKRIAEEGGDKEPKPQAGADEDVLLAYEDGHADAAWFIGQKAKDALDDWLSA